MPLTLQQKPVVIFSDFDGTITQRDVIMMIMEAFAPPVWQEIIDDILNKRTLSIREGVDQLFQLIPGTQKEAIEAFVAENVKFREGFETFLPFCQSQKIPFIVVSGGIDFFLHRVLAPYQDQLKIYCNGSIFHPNYIEVLTPYANSNCKPCGQCGCCKLLIMEEYPSEQYFRVAIGDSLTDLAMAKTADWVFARSKLIQYCQEEDIPFTPFETFQEVQKALLERVQQETPANVVS